MDPAAMRPVSLSPLPGDFGLAGSTAKSGTRTLFTETSAKPINGCSDGSQDRPQSGKRARRAVLDCWGPNGVHNAWSSTAHRDRNSLSRSSCRSPVHEYSRQGRHSATDRHSPDITTPRAQTPVAKAAQRRTEERRLLYAAPPSQRGSGSPSLPKAPDAETQQLQRVLREANMAKAFRELSLGHQWLRIVLDGIESVLEILKPRVKNLEQCDQCPTALDLQRTAEKLHEDILGGFQELQDDCTKDEALLDVRLERLARCTADRKSWASGALPFANCSKSVDRSALEPITPEQARAIEVLLRFVTGLDMMPVWRNALEAAVDVIQLASSAGSGGGLGGAVTSTQQMMHELQGVLHDTQDGFDRILKTMVDREERVLEASAARHEPTKRRSVESVLEGKASPEPVSEDSDAEEEKDEVKEMPTLENNPLHTKRRTTFFSRRATNPSLHTFCRTPSFSIKDNQSASLWGVTFDQLCEFHDEVIDDLCGYCEVHRTCGQYGERMQICLLNENCEWDHRGMIYVKQSDLTEGEETEQLLPNTYTLVDREVKPRTKDAGCSYALMLNPDGIKSNIFVTHAWGQPIKELVDTLQMTVTSEDVLWICSLALNQHDPSQIHMDVSEDNLIHCPFFIALEQSKKQVVALDADLRVPDRAWCTFEILLASIHGVNVSLWFYQLDRLDALLEKVQNIDMQEVVASRPHDLESIQEGIEDIGDFDEVNERVRDVLYDRLSFHKMMLTKGNYIPSVVQQVPEREAQEQKDKDELEVCRKRLFDLEQELQDQKRRQADITHKINQKRRNQQQKQKEKKRKAETNQQEQNDQPEPHEEDEADEKAIQKLKKEEAQAQVRLELLEEIRQSVERELREALEQEMERKEAEFAQKEKSIEQECKSEKRKCLVLTEELEQTEARQRPLLEKAKELERTQAKLAEVEEELSWLRGEHAVAQYALKRKETKPGFG